MPAPPPAAPPAASPQPPPPPAPQPQTITGQIDSSALATAQGAALKVCLDQDGDFVCGASEPTAQADATGGFSLAFDSGIKTETLNLIAMFPAVGAPAQAAYALAARARTGTAVSALTTLEAAHAATPAGWMRMSPTVDIHDPANAAAKQINLAIQPAYMKAVASLTTRTVDALAPQPAAMRAAQVVEQVLTDYIDPQGGQLLRTVSPRTVAVQTMASISPSTCDAGTVTAMTINTSGAAPILDKETYVAGTVQLAGGTAMTTGIRGRGNSTWDMPKKPYRLKLDTKASMLGMPADKDWVLLANFSDKTLMRNSVATCLSQMLGFDYTPPERYVELTLNNEYLGVYQLTDQIEAEDARVNIGKATTTIDDPGMAFLLEIDARLDEDFWFYSARRVPYTVKSDVVAEQMPNIRNFIASLETAMWSPGFKDPESGYGKYLETDTLVDYYLLKQYIRNHDAFGSSTFTWRPRDGKLHFGPVWDHDLSAGNINYDGSAATTGWEDYFQSPYIVRLMQDEQFVRHLNVRWKYLSARLPEIQTFIDSTAQTLEAPQQRNFTKWPILGSYVWPNAVVTGSYAGEVAYLKTWLTSRGQWMNTQLTAQ
ncbi:CotH kinase family protein [Variovorax rhizosphaerae]|uniref:CotH kinase family protein n=1 Tax=Variovorax rhizosphaerae TaxID=1836200 RepID=A0ABU8WVG7_9BURK